MSGGLVKVSPIFGAATRAVDPNTGLLDPIVYRFLADLRGGVAAVTAGDVEGPPGPQGPAGPTGAAGPTGPTGPAPNLSIGTVTTVAAGGSATASIGGVNPNYTVNLGIPTGATGATGPTGPAPNLTIGTVTTVAAGGSATASIGGSNPNYTVNLGIPTGATGAPGAAGNPTLVSSGLFAAPAATLDIALTGGHARYVVLVDQLQPVTANQELQMLLSYDNAATYAASGYRFAAERVSADATTGIIAGNSVAQVSLSRAQVSSGGAVSQVRIELGPPASSGRFTGYRWAAEYGFTGGLLDSVVGGGDCTASSLRPTHLRLRFASGNINTGARWSLSGGT